MITTAFKNDDDDDDKGEKIGEENAILETQYTESIGDVFVRFLIEIKRKTESSTISHGI